MKKDKSEQVEEEKIETGHETEGEKPVEHEEKEAGAKENPFQRFLALAKRHPRRSVVVGVGLLVVLLLAVPLTRYPILGLAIKKPVSLKITDAKTGEAVSEATVKLGSLEAKTDNEGVAKFPKAKLGKASVTVSKKYYETRTFSLFVGLKAPPTNTQQLTAQGRPVKVRVSNKISGKAIENASIKIDSEEYKTGDDGEVQVILAPDAAEAKVSITANGFNDTEAKIVAADKSDVDEQNNLKITPVGKVFFLSKRTGKIDVMKSNLDGSGAEVVLAGTGKEQDTDTILLASRDWKYLALKSRREGDKAKLYLIETATGKQTVMDEGNAFFDVVGWLDDTFVFGVDRQNIPEQQPKRYALKSYNASKKAIAVLDETDSVPTQWSRNYQTFENFYLTKQGIVYTKFWRTGYQGNIVGNQHAIAFIKTDGSGKKDLKTFPSESVSGLQARAYAPDEIYFIAYKYGGNQPEYWEYDDGAIKAASINADQFNKPYPTFLFSPSGNATFWDESRDGKNTLFIGNSEAKEGQEIATLSELTPYGWYSEDYLLASKKGSELYIMAKEKGATPLKITDYHKPQFNADGYGYGYGGF